MEMKFLDLTVDNAFDFCGVLDAVGLNTVIGVFDKDEINAMRSQKDMKEIGIVVAMKAVGAIMKNMSSAREEIYRFLVGCTVWDNNQPVTKDDLRKLPISQFVKLLKAFAKKEDLQDFLSEVLTFVDTEQTNSENSVIVDTTISESTLMSPSDSPDSRPHVMPF